MRMAIVTVPVDQAQGVVDAVVAAGIKAILDSAPTKLVVPENVRSPAPISASSCNVWPTTWMTDREGRPVEGG